MIALGLIAGAAIGMSAPVVADANASFVASAVAQGFTPCVTEDDPRPCYWDAATRGNGQGRSFVWTGDEMFYADGSK